MPCLYLLIEKLHSRIMISIPEIPTIKMKDRRMLLGFGIIITIVSLSILFRKWNRSGNHA